VSATPDDGVGDMGTSLAREYIDGRPRQKDLNKPVTGIR